MGAKDSKPSCISYEDAIKRGKCEIVYFFPVFIIANETPEKRKRITLGLDRRVMLAYHYGPII